jgi:hypothetical protein
LLGEGSAVIIKSNPGGVALAIGGIFELANGGGAASVGLSLQPVSSANLACNLIAVVGNGTKRKLDGVGVVGKGGQIKEMVSKVDVETDIILNSGFLSDNTFLGSDGFLSLVLGETKSEGNILSLLISRHII